MKFPRLHVPTVMAAILMVVAALLSVAVTPRLQVGDHIVRVDLEALIPNAFAGWEIDQDELGPIVADAAEDEHIGTIYSQVLTRTYSNKDGRQVMLTLAYGRDQSDSLAIHRPEVCYSAQGFKVTTPHNHLIHVANRPLEVKVVSAQLGWRFEPITYWFVIGNRVATGRLQRKIEQLKYGLTGKIPDGMLVRVSSLEQDTAMAFAHHEQFINDLVLALDTKGRERLIGTRN
ncbi:MAG: EpsI family protein [Candidatus Thiodiazotropha sp. (ex Ustalcina ferruginea)]|nr:EpsI family protein [Candidatus Thiodiazotropha sp. (ex Ustalcina ferruginea)]